MARTRIRPHGTGATRQLPSGRWQARFRGPDGIMRPAPVTFDTKLDADAWLKAQVFDVDRGLWSAPEPRQGGKRGQTVEDYARTWLATRELKPRTRALYRDLLAQMIVPALGDVPVDRLTPATVRNWYASLDPTRPTRRAHAYSLLRSIMTTAVVDELRVDNPCRIPKAGTTKTKRQMKTATLDELGVIVDALPSRYRAMALLAAWCGLRFGELVELRRSDVVLRRDDDGEVVGGVLRVERGVTRVDGEVVVGDPKSEAGRRTVAIPPHMLPLLVGHLEEHTGPESDALLFPARSGGHMAPASLYRVWYPAREKAGRPDLRFHDLRHTGATNAAVVGATLAELMARMGHSTPQAALLYQHAGADRDAFIAEALSGLANAQRPAV
jgi:integrase